MKRVMFRAWDKHNKKMVSNKEICLVDGKMMSEQPYQCDYFNFPVIQNGFLVAVGNYIENRDNFVLMQYTGLEDKNHKDIYESDIINIRDVLYVIAWDESSACFYLCQITPTDYVTDARINRLFEYEVVGNVWESKELLSSFDTNVSTEDQDEGE